MKKSCTPLTLMLLATFACMLWPVACTEQDDTHSTSEEIVYTGTGDDVFGTTTYTYVLRYRLQREKVIGTLKMNDMGVFNLEHGIHRGDTLEFVVKAEQFEFHFVLRELDNRLDGGVVELDEDSLSGLTRVSFMRKENE